MTKQTYNIGEIEFTPDGKHVVVGSRNGQAPMQVWRVNDGTLIKTLPEAGSSIEFSWDGQFMLSIDDCISVWNVANWRLIKRFDDLARKYPKTVALSEDGKWLFRSREDGGVSLMRMPTVLLPPAVGPRDVDLRWFGAKGRYQVEQRNNLTDAWQTIGPVLDTNQYLFERNQSESYFRVVEVQ